MRRNTSDSTPASPALHRFADGSSVPCHSCGPETASAAALGELAEIGSDSLVLNIGSDAGLTAVALAERFSCRVVGVDPVEEQYRRAAMGSPISGRDDRVRLLHGRFPAVELGRREFDAVVSRNAVVHRSDTARFVERCRSLLKPGGRLAVAEYHLKRRPVTTVERALVYNLEHLWGSHIRLLCEWLSALSSGGLWVNHFDDCTSLLDGERHSRKPSGSGDAGAKEDESARKLHATLLGWGILGSHRLVARKSVLSA